MAFTLDRYADLTHRLDTSDIDFDDFREQPLDAESLRCLRYMHDVEFHTICYLRDLLVTRAHKDPAITAFLTFWCYEEYWHGEAISHVLDAHGEVAGDPRIKIKRGSLGVPERVSTLTSMLASAVLPDFVAVHMTWGAINEWTTQAGYAQLVKRTAHPTLATLLRRIMKQEGRHIDAYASEATKRLTNNRRAQRIVRLLLKHRWAPVGSGVMPPPEVDFMVSHLFSGKDGAVMAARIDSRIDRLPGLQGLELVQNAVRQHGTLTAV